MRILTSIDTIWLIKVLPASPSWTSQITYDVVASLEDEQSVWAVLMCLFAITTEYNGPLAAAHAHIDVDRYDMVHFMLLDSPNWTSNYLRRRSIA